MVVDQETQAAVLAKLPGKIDHGNVVEVDDKFLLYTFTLTEKDIFDWIKYYVYYAKTTKYSEADLLSEDANNYLYFKGTIPILLVSHVDVVLAESRRLFLTEKSRMLTGDVDTYLGGDDRAGVAAMLWMVSDGLKPHMLFTKGEEHGLIGAGVAAVAFKPSNIKYIIALDRSGDNECAFYNNGNEEFKKYIKNFGFKEVSGTGNDIRELCPAWNISGANISIGYENAHTVRDYISMPVLMRCIARTESMLKDPPKTKFKFVRAIEETEIWINNKFFRFPKNYGSLSSRHRDWYGREEDNENEFEDEYDREAFEREFEDDWRRASKSRSGKKCAKNARMPAKKTKETIFPKLPFIYETTEEQKQKILQSMSYIARIMHWISFDFSDMTWRYPGLEQVEHIDVETLELYGLFDIVPRSESRLLRNAINYLDAHEYIWYDESECV